MQLQRLDLAVAEYRRARAAVEEVHAFLLHVVQVLGHARHVLRVALDRDHRDFLRALTERFARAVDRGVAAADHRHARAELALPLAHADVAQERQAVEHAVLVFAFGADAVRIDQADGQDDAVVVLPQVVPGDVLADFGVRLDRDSELHQAGDLTVEDVLRQHPVGNAAAIQSARSRRFLEDRDLVAQSGELIRGAVSSRPRPDDRDRLAVRRTGLHDVLRKGQAEVAEEPLDRANRNGLVVLATVTGLLAGVIADAAGHRGERHVLLDQGVGVEVLAALHQVEIALDLLVRAARIVTGRHLVVVHGPDRAPVARRKEVLPLFLRGRWGDSGERHLQPVGNMSAFGRHLVTFRGPA